MCSAAPAWAPCARPSSATSACRASGRIFEAYRAGMLPPYAGPFEDDDEVAVIHGPTETGYVALSEAMVNIRATLAQAEAEGMIAATTRDALAAARQGAVLPRSQLRSPARAGGRGSPAGTPGRGAADLAAGRSHRPEAPRCRGHAGGDARPCWRAMPSPSRSTTCSSGPRCGTMPRWRRQARWAPVVGQMRRGCRPTRILDELRLDPAAYGAARDRTLLRLLAHREARRRHQPAAKAAKRAALDRLRARHGLFRRADLDRWARG